MQYLGTGSKLHKGTGEAGEDRDRKPYERDLVSFCEVYGMPLRIGKYDPGASKADKQELLDAIVRIGSDAAGIIPETTMIEFKEANKTTSADIYEQLARYCDEQISKAILGQTLTSDSGGGSYAQSKTHNEVRHDLTAADAKALAVTIRRDIIRPLVEYNFGADANVPFIRFNSDEEEDQKEAVDMYRTLKKLIEVLGLAEDATEEDILKAVKKAAEAAGAPETPPAAPPAEVVANSTILGLLDLPDTASTAEVSAKIVGLKNGDQQLALRVRQLEEAAKERETNTLVQTALKDGKITAAQKEWARSYALKDTEGFKKFLELAGPAVPMGEIGLKDAPEGEKLDTNTMAILKNLGISAEDAKKYGNKEVTL